ncbi:MAG: S8 family serine peptidase [Myxococcota bacterium]
MRRNVLALIALCTGCTEFDRLDGLGDDRQMPLAVDDGLEHRLVVKFEPEAGLQLLADGRIALDRASAAQAVNRLAGDAGVGFRALLPRVDEQLAPLRAEGKGPSTAFSTVLTLDRDLPEGALVSLAEAVRLVPGVAYVWLEPLLVPPPGDYAPPSSDFSAQQRYRRLGADGLGFARAYNRGQRGAGVHIADCEYGWRLTHEDLVDLGARVEPGQTVPDWVADYGWDDHGTAVLGEIGAVANGYGVTGMASDADVDVFPEYSDQEGARRAAAIASAIARSAPGDVVVLEMQTTGALGGYGPAEYDPVVWDLVREATDAGIVVVAAAGNGAEDLDDPAYDAWRDRGDSGAILVGAGASAARTRLYFSTYGARVDVHAWGENVTSTGYGDLAAFGGDRDQEYTAYFNGTSSATPLVAAAVAVLQGHALQTWGSPLTPAEIRRLLVQTGTPQLDPQQGAIGPLPNVVAALGALDDLMGGAAAPELGQVPVTGLAGAPGDTLRYVVDVPDGTETLTVTLSGGSGDADLYVRQGAVPTAIAWDCRPFTPGNDEVCTFADPAPGPWHVLVRGFATFADTTLSASLTAP